MLTGSKPRIDSINELFEQILQWGLLEYVNINLEK